MAGRDKVSLEKVLGGPSAEIHNSNELQTVLPRDRKRRVLAKDLSKIIPPTVPAKASAASADVVSTLLTAE